MLPLPDGIIALFPVLFVALLARALSPRWRPLSFPPMPRISVNPSIFAIHCLRVATRVASTSTLASSTLDRFRARKCVRCVGRENIKRTHWKWKQSWISVSHRPIPLRHIRRAWRRVSDRMPPKSSTAWKVIFRLLCSQSIHCLYSMAVANAHR